MPYKHSRTSSPGQDDAGPQVWVHYMDDYVDDEDDDDDEQSDGDHVYFEDESRNDVEESLARSAFVHAVRHVSH